MLSLRFTLVNSREFTNDGAKPLYVPETVTISVHTHFGSVPTRSDVDTVLRHHFPGVPRDTEFHGTVDGKPVDMSDEQLRAWCGRKGSTTVDVDLVAGPPGMQLLVHSMTCKPVTIVCVPANTIRDLKFLVQQRRLVPMEEQKLIFAGKQLEDARTVGDYRLQHTATLHLVTRMRGGMMHDTSGRRDMEALLPVLKKPVEPHRGGVHTLNSDEVLVATLDGTSYVVPVAPDDTLAVFRRNVYVVTGCAPGSQRLVHGGNVFQAADDGLLLSALGVVPKTKVFLLCGPRGGGAGGGAGGAGAAISPP
jgi:hypothetical protein